MAFKLIESAQTRWRAVNAPHPVALIRPARYFKNGKLIDDPTNHRVVISKSRDTPIRRSCLFLSALVSVLDPERNDARARFRAVNSSPQVIR